MMTVRKTVKKTVKMSVRNWYEKKDPEKQLKWILRKIMKICKDF